MTIRNYEFPDFSKKSSTQEIKPYEEPRFEAQINGKQVDQIHKKAESFKLDRVVIDQLGIEDRERQEREARLQQEIERRWEQAAEKAEVAGYTKGLEEGKAEAFKAELPRVRERIEKLDRLLQDFDNFRERIFAANEAFLMDLISEVAGMIVLREVEIDKEYVRRLVTALLQQLSTREDIKIYLSPQDINNVEALRQGIDKELGKLNNTTIDASPEVPVGGCRIETRFGVVDTSIASQIENVKKALKI